MENNMRLKIKNDHHNSSQSVKRDSKPKQSQLFKLQKYKR